MRRMEKFASLVIAVFAVAACALSLPASSAAGADEGAHTPAKGNPERQAILDALRGEQKVVFQVHYLKAHGDWAWIDVTPLDKQGKAVAEGGPALLERKDGAWVVLDLGKVPEDPDDPLGAEDASAGFVRNLRATFPGVPADIFPKPSR